MEFETSEGETVVAEEAPAATFDAQAVDRELIARRAYEIHVSGEGGTDFDDWLRAERELDEERHAGASD